MYLITAYFDEKTERTIQRHTDHIAELTGNTFLTEHHVPPHMTVSSIEARNPEILKPAFRLLDGTIQRGNIHIMTVGAFFPYVLYASPVVNEYLTDLSRNVFAAVRDIDETSVSRFYRPFSWVPHITLGKKLSPEQMRQAFEYMQSHFVPFEAVVSALGLSEVNPHRDVERIVL